MADDSATNSCVQSTARGLGVPPVRAAASASCTGAVSVPGLMNRCCTPSSASVATSSAAASVNAMPRPPHLPPGDTVSSRPAHRQPKSAAPGGTQPAFRLPEGQTPINTGTGWLAIAAPRQAGGRLDSNVHALPGHGASLRWPGYLQLIGKPSGLRLSGACDQNGTIHDQRPGVL